jgi:hypothetical protein
VRKYMLASATLALTASSVVIGVAPGADAATICSGTGCQGYAAAQTQCAKDAEIIYSVNKYVGSTLAGNLQLKYSPSCRTTWARAVTYLDDEVKATDISSNAVMPCQSAVGQNGCNTGMIYDAGITSHATAEVYYDDQLKNVTWSTGSY